jgi:hypothetical protein
VPRAGPFSPAQKYRTSLAHGIDLHEVPRQGGKRIENCLGSNLYYVLILSKKVSRMRLDDGIKGNTSGLASESETETWLG